MYTYTYIYMYIYVYTYIYTYINYHNSIFLNVDAFILAATVSHSYEILQINDDNELPNFLNFLMYFRFNH
jgi:hypothetical protein